MSGEGALTGPQRAAVVLAQLGDARAGAILAQLSERDVIQLMAEVSKLPSLDPKTVTGVVADFVDAVVTHGTVRQGGVEKAHRWLCERLGSEQAAQVRLQLEMASQPRPLDLLEQVGTDELARCLAGEHPQTIAVVVSRLPPDSASQLLARFDKAVSVDVIRRLATTTVVPAEVVRRITECLGARLSTFGVDSKRVGGVSNVATVLNSVVAGTDQAILSRIEHADPELAAAIRSEMFLFEDMLSLEDAALQMVLRSASLRDVALALKTAPPDMVEKFTRNMSVWASDDLAEEMEGMGPQRKSAIESAQSSLVRLVLELRDAGVIDVGRPDDQLIA